VGRSKTTRRRRRRWPALLRRFPSWRAPRSSWLPIAPERAENYPALVDDIAVLDRVVGPVFAESDREALQHQNRYRRQQVIILLGSALLTGLGGLQAVFPGYAWPGLLLALLGVGLAVVSNTVNELNALEHFMTERVKAERLRSTYFRFLSRTGLYAGDDRVSVLRRAVLSIKSGEEPS
jgi:hypothetical protein